jgi:hypothetical protein
MVTIYSFQSHIHFFVDFYYYRYPLINYAKHVPNPVFRPELKLSFSIYPKGTEIPQSITPQPKTKPAKSLLRPTRATPSPSAYVKKPRARAPSGVASILPMNDLRSLQYSPSSRTDIPFELTDNGYYQIGLHGPHWLLNLTIAFAENLSLLDPPTQNEQEQEQQPSEQDSYYFYYSFLGNDILTSPFTTLSAPSFPSERTTFRIRASENDLQSFLSTSDKLVIHLCKAGSLVGFTEVDLASVVAAATTADRGPHTSEGYRQGLTGSPQAWKDRKKAPRVVEHVYGIFYCYSPYLLIRRTCA